MDINTMTTTDIADYLKGERNCAFILWQVSNVLDKATEIGRPVIESEAETIIKSLNKDADCNYGITWDHLEDAIIELSDCSATNIINRLEKLTLEYTNTDMTPLDFGEDVRVILGLK